MMRLEKRRMHARHWLYVCGLAALLSWPPSMARAQSAAAQSAAAAAPLETDYVIHDFRFASGEVLPELRIHYTTLGKARRDAHGRITNAVLLLHGTGGSGRSFLRERFAGLFAKGQPLD